MTTFSQADFDREMQTLRSKANVYHRIADVARELGPANSIANQAEQAAHAYETAMYEKSRWHARDIALAYGFPKVAECLLYETEIDDPLGLPAHLTEAIQRWKALIHLRPPRGPFD